MNTRTLAVGGFLLLLLAGATSGQPGGDRFGFALAALPRVTEQDLADEAITGRALDVERDDLLQRTWVKREMATELVNGRISLAEATDAFLAVDEGYPRSLEILRKMFPGCSDRERAARNVIAWAFCGGEPRPDLVVRLEGEFRSLFPLD